MTNRLKTLLLTTTLVLPITLLTSCSSVGEETSSETIRGNIKAKELDNGFYLTKEDIENNSISLPVLQKLFDGLDYANIKNITTKTEKVDSYASSIELYKINLQPNKGYKFDNSTLEISSNDFQVISKVEKLSITPKTPETIYEDDITTNLSSKETINKLFTLSNPQDFDKVTVKLQNSSSISVNSNNKVILTPKIGYIFENGTKKLESQEFNIIQNLNIISKTPETIYENDITTNLQTDSTINKLFTLSNSQNFNKVTIKLQNSSSTSVGLNNKVVLTAKEGYIFENGTKELLSQEFIITKNPSNLIPIDGITLNPSSPNTINEKDIKNNPISLPVLQKLFNGLDKSKLDNLNVILSSGAITPTSKHTITLTAKTGYQLLDSNNQVIKSLASKEFNVIQNLNIISKTPETIFEDDITTNLSSKETINKLFTLSNPQDFNKVTIKLQNSSSTSAGSNNKVVLTAKEGYIFENGSKELLSQEFTIIEFLNLKITAEGEVQGFVDPTLNNGTLVIKESYDGIIVKKIANFAFGNDNLTSLTLPNSLTTIGSAAFANNKLTSLTLPNSLTTIQDSAFGNNKLTSLTFGNSLTTIGTSAFSINNLTSLTIPNSVTTIGDNAFRDNQITDGNKLTLPSKFNSPTEIERIGIIFDYNSDNLKITPEGEVQGFVDPSLNNGTLVIKENYNGITIKRIGASAFYNKNLTSLTLPNSLTTIQDFAFQSNNLTSLTLPNSLTSIGKTAFYSNNLTSLTLSNSLITIGSSAFSINNLTSLTLPNSLTSIESHAFSVNKLTSLTIPNSVTTIGDNAFRGNQITDRNKLTLPSNFNIPEELKRIGINLTSSKEILLTSNSLNNYNNLMKVITVTNKFKIK